MKKRSFLIILMFLCFIISKAQRNEIYSKQIKSLQVVVNEDWLSPPIMTLGGGNTLNIDFDDLTHTFQRYTYKIEHCEADWTVSNEIFESDFMEGFNNNNIEDYEESLNTTVLYNHYSLTIPNDKCKLKISGNYKLTVYNDETDEKVLSACFSIVEPLMGVSMEVTPNTDIDVNKSHQQVNINVSYGTINVTDPAGQIKTVVMQNGRWDNAVIDVKPNYIMNNQLKWIHNRSLIFDGSNEYHKFELLDVHYPTMGIDNIRFIDNFYHCNLFQNEPRMNYVYDADANGAFYIRNKNNEENERLCDYVWVHYSLKCDRINGRVFVNGVWTNDLFTPEYEMKYNEIGKCYEASILQKQGYYSFQYLALNDDGSTSYMPEEGSFYQTENKYQALVYYKGTGERTYRLVGYSQIDYK